MSLPGVPALLLLVAVAAPARADEVSDLLNRAKQTQVAVPVAQSLEATPEQCAPLANPTRPGKICDTVDDCMALCACACKFDKTKWDATKKDDGSTTCTGLPETGVGMLPPDSPDLLTVSTMSYLRIPRGLKATRAALDGLIALNDHLAGSANRRRLNFTVRVGSCYRRHLEDSVPECGLSLKAKYMLDNKVGDDAEKRAHWRESADPNNLGLSWPGRTPHSGGYGCDIILSDSRGQDCFDWRAGVGDAPTCSIPTEQATALLDEEATSAGVDGRRLVFEAWHYEWGPDAKGCRFPDCPSLPTGKPGNR